MHMTLYVTFSAISFSARNINIIFPCTYIPTWKSCFVILRYAQFLSPTQLRDYIRCTARKSVKAIYVPVSEMPPKKKHIRQHDHEIGYWTGGKRDVGRFEALANFGVKLLKHVVAPQELPSETCFVVRVTQKMGASQSLEKGLVIYLHSYYCRSIPREDDFRAALDFYPGITA